MDKKGFTLAEVLITLGIIGVVAAMTIPTLIQNYNKRTWDTGATVFERKLEEALKTMNSQQTLAGHSTTESFVEELSKHFKTNKICSNDNLLDCFSEVVYWGGGEATPEEVDMSKIKTAKNFGQDDWNTNIIGVQFANGTSALIAYNPTSTCSQNPYSNQIKGGDCLAILYDTSANKNPNTSGKDLRANGNVQSLGGTTCAFEIRGICYTAPFSPTPHTWKACNNEGVSTDPEDIAFMQKYKINYCMSSMHGTEDYWAGAVKACGGTDKMPNEQQLSNIAEYLYPNLSINNSESYCANDSNGNPSTCWQNESSLGFNTTGTGGQGFAVWSNIEGSQNTEDDNYYGAYIRIFMPYGTIWYTDFRYGLSTPQAICIGNQ